MDRLGATVIGRTDYFLLPAGNPLPTLSGDTVQHISPKCELLCVGVLSLFLSPVLRSLRQRKRLLLPRPLGGLATTVQQQQQQPSPTAYCLLRSILPICRRRRRLLLTDHDLSTSARQSRLLNNTRARQSITLPKQQQPNCATHYLSSV